VSQLHGVLSILKQEVIRGGYTRDDSIQLGYDENDAYTKYLFY